VTLDFSGSGGLFAPRLPYVKTKAIKAAAKGHEDEIVRAIGIPWRGRDHIPYPDHDDKNPSWRQWRRAWPYAPAARGRRIRFSMSP
jgi:hypothetical protein